MKMSKELHHEGMAVAEQFFKLMPKKSKKVFESLDEHEQLAYFYCWNELLKGELQ